MNGEIAQVCNIVLASKSALKKRNGIKYRPAYYEKETEFIFLNNQKYKFCCFVIDRKSNV